MKKAVVSLSKIIQKFGNDRTEELLKDFFTEENEDVEKFLKLRDRAIRYDNANRGKTYLVVDEKEFFNKQERIKILGFFTLTIKVYEFEGLSKTKIQQIDGFSKNATNTIGYLIGQLGKNDLYKNEITGDEILNYALNKIDIAKDIIGVNSIMIECEDKSKLINFYKRNGFINNGKNEKDTLIQMIKIIK